MIKLTDEQLEFLKDNQPLLQKNDFDHFFQLAFLKYGLAGSDDFVKLFLDCGISYEEMINGMNTIPTGFFYESFIEELSIPESVEYIEDYAFHSCHIHHLRIPSTLPEENIKSEAIFRCKIEDFIIPKNYDDIDRWVRFSDVNIKRV